MFDVLETLYKSNTPCSIDEIKACCLFRPEHVYIKTRSSFKGPLLHIGYERKIQCSYIDLPSTPSVTAYWMWNEKGSNFVPYDTESSVDIELAFDNGSMSVDLSTCTAKLPYTVDFLTMEQIRHRYDTRRKVQRCALVPGTDLQSILALAPQGTAHSTGSTGSYSSACSTAKYPSSMPTTTNPFSAFDNATPRTNYADTLTAGGGYTSASTYSGSAVDPYQSCSYFLLCERFLNTLKIPGDTVANISSVVNWHSNNPLTLVITYVYCDLIGN